VPKEKSGILGLGLLEGKFLNGHRLRQAGLGHWSCQTIPGKEGEETIRCTHTFGPQSTMTVDLTWWGVEINKIPYSKMYHGPLGSEIRVPGELDIEIIDPKNLREDIVDKENYLDPEVGARLHGKRRVILSADNVSVGVETGSEPP